MTETNDDNKKPALGSIEEDNAVPNEPPNAAEATPPEDTKINPDSQKSSSDHKVHFVLPNTSSPSNDDDIISPDSERSRSTTTNEEFPKGEDSSISSGSNRSGSTRSNRSLPGNLPSSRPSNSLPAASRPSSRPQYRYSNIRAFRSSQAPGSDRRKKKNRFTKSKIGYPYQPSYFAGIKETTKETPGTTATKSNKRQSTMSAPGSVNLPSVSSHSDPGPPDAQPPSPKKQPTVSFQEDAKKAGTNTPPPKKKFSILPISFPGKRSLSDGTLPPNEEKSGGARKLRQLRKSANDSFQLDNVPEPGARNVRFQGSFQLDNVPKRGSIGSQPSRKNSRPPSFQLDNVPEENSASFKLENIPENRISSVGSSLSTIFQRGDIPEMLTGRQSSVGSSLTISDRLGSVPELLKGSGFRSRKSSLTRPKKDSILGDSILLGSGTRRLSAIEDVSDQMRHQSEDTELSKSEQFFVDQFLGPTTEEEPQSERTVKFSTSYNQDAESLAVELEDVGRYLMSLKDEIRRSQLANNLDLSNNTKTSTDSSNSSKSNEKHATPKGLYGANVAAPKSTKRFSMAIHASDAVVTFPCDCFSLLAVNGPIDCPLAFTFGLGVCFFQFTFLALAIASVVHQEWNTLDGTDNPSNPWHFIPSNTSPLVLATQILAVLAYLVLAETSLKEIITAVEVFPQRSKVMKGDKYRCLVFSSLCRGILGAMTVFTTLLLVITSTTVIDIILDLLAMNFIADIGKMAFELALWGKYGSKLEREALAVEDLPMPDCVLRPPSQVRTRSTVYSTIAFMGLTLITTVICQRLPRVWATCTFRVEFIPSNYIGTDRFQDLRKHSGCYDITGETNPGFFGDMFKTYKAQDDSKAQDDAIFQYCFDPTHTWGNRWFLHTSKYADPCDIPPDEYYDVLAISSSTSPNMGTFDISEAFSDRWFDAQGMPIPYLYFMSDGDFDKEDMQCGKHPGDGRCDTELNTFDWNYDNGDCCASTCTTPGCGSEALKEIFGVDLPVGKYGDGFPNCVDPSMVPITIALHDIIDSSTYEELGDSMNNPGVEVTPSKAQDRIVEPIMVLDCDDRNVLTVHVKEAMAHQTETVWVADGATCTLRINNSTSTTIAGVEPILYVNYTIYNGEYTPDQDESIVILREHSANSEFASFGLVMECYYGLSEYVDNSTIYTGTGPHHQAIEWLRLTRLNLEDSRNYRNSRNSGCEDETFIERYALSVLNFAAPIESSEAAKTDPDEEMAKDDTELLLPDVAPIDLTTDNTSFFVTTTPAITQGRLISYDRLWIAEQRQCIWRTVECHGGFVERLDLRSYNLHGTIASSIGLLTKLKELQLGDNYLLGGSIPSEIGHLTSLEKLGLNGNSLVGTIPTEIGNLESLEVLDLSNNTLTGLIPTELEKLVNLTHIYVADNSNLTIPFTSTKLNDLVYKRCVICKSRRDEATEKEIKTSECQEMIEIYQQNNTMMTINECEKLNASCRFC